MKIFALSQTGALGPWSPYPRAGSEEMIHDIESFGSIAVSSEPFSGRRSPRCGKQKLKTQDSSSLSEEYSLRASSRDVLFHILNYYLGHLMRKVAPTMF